MDEGELKDVLKNVTRGPVASVTDRLFPIFFRTLEKGAKHDQKHEEIYHGL